MPKALEIIADREGEAAKMLDTAKAEAHRIAREAEEAAPKVHAKAYEEAIAAAEQEAAELKKRARELAGLKANESLQDAEQQMRSLREKMKTNLEAAVKAVLAEILS